MFQRLALTALHRWGEKEGRKPLVLRGARQVGKTTLVKLFAREFDV
ncbi:AAA family ATPase, partial [Bacteroides cellulosilyticus]